jgi:hypothetical protein
MTIAKLPELLRGRLVSGSSRLRTPRQQWFAIPRPRGFEARWVAMPAAMSLQTFNTARKAAGRPSFCAYPLPKCHTNTARAVSQQVSKAFMDAVSPAPP